MNTTLFENPLQTYQFLTVVNYINTLCDIFYSQGIIQKNEQCQFVPILNTFFEYLNQSKDEIEIKRNLVQRFLQGSDLYGGRKNETLDLKYVNATFEYIINSIVFSKFGGIYGYLTVMTNLSKNLILSSFKQSILDNLSDLKYINENGSISKLSALTTKKVAETLIWPLFPSFNEDMKIIDINYIYAQAGLILARSSRMNLTNISFAEYITMSMTVELSAFKNKISQSSLLIFTLPALMYYAYENKSTFEIEKIEFLIQDVNFMIEVFHVLFTHLHNTFKLIEDKSNENNTLHQFYTAMFNFKNRTVMAEENLRKFCSFKKESDYIKEIPNYKFFASSTKCNTNGTLLPNLDKEYSKQVQEIKIKYRLHMKVLIRKAFPPDVVNLISSSDTTVYAGRVVPIIIVCSPVPCEPYIHYFNSSTNLFAIRSHDVDYFYALVQNQTSLTLLKYDDDQEAFLNKLDLKKGTKFEVSEFAKVLKYPSSVTKDNNYTENFDTFVDRIADIKANFFGNQLYQFGIDRTLGEKIVDFALAFVPFYHCITYAQAGKTAESIFACTADAISLFPFVGQIAKLTFKLSNMGLGLFMKTFIFRQALRFAFTTAAKETIVRIALMAKEVVFTKNMFKSLSLGLLRTVDPGFELVGMLLKNGRMVIGKLFKKTWIKIGKAFPSIGVTISKSNRLWKSLIDEFKGSRKFIPINIGSLRGHKVFINIYSGGVKPCGPKYVRLPERIAELRRIEGYKLEMPVIRIISNMKKVYYKKVNLITGNTYGIKLKLNENGWLERVQKPLRIRLKTIVVEGLSGRGLLMGHRTDVIEKTAKFVSKSMKSKISIVQAKEIMEQYFLSTGPDRILSGSHNYNFGQLQDGNHVLDLSMKKYLNHKVMPTYNQFAKDWIENGYIDHVYHNWHLNDPMLLRELLLKENLDFITSEDIFAANERIVQLYGPNHQVEMGLSIENLIGHYQINYVNKFLNFEDFYILMYWSYNSYGNFQFNGALQMRVRNALYRLAIRQADEFWNVKAVKLYHGELMKPEVFQIKINEERNEVFSKNKIIISSLNENEEVRFLTLQGSSALRDNIPILYEIDLQLMELAVNLNLVSGPYVVPRFAILPETNFKVNDVTNKMINGINVKVIKIQSEPIDKEIWMHRIIHQIEELQTSGVQFYFKPHLQLKT